MSTAITRTIFALLLLSQAWPALAQEPKDKPLPTVLLIGDSIYQQHAREAGKELKDQANVSVAGWPSEVIENSTNAIKHLDRLLGIHDAKGEPVPEDKRLAWDLIHVNVGLGDLIYRAPNMESFRVMPIHVGGVVATAPRQYEKNLDELIRLIKAKAPQAKIVWASTTPIRHSRSNVFKMGSEITYNEIAERVMNKHRVPINDMYSYARSIMNMDKPAGHGFDPFNFDKKPIHPPVVATIRKQLGIPAPKKEAEPVASKD